MRYLLAFGCVRFAFDYIQVIIEQNLMKFNPQNISGFQL